MCITLFSEGRNPGAHYTGDLIASEALRVAGRAARKSGASRAREQAREFDVDQSTILDWERGLSAPCVRYLPRIMTLIGQERVPSPDAPLGDRIRAYRRRKGLTQPQFAEQLGLQPGSISDWELGKHPPF